MADTPAIQFPRQRVRRERLWQPSFHRLYWAYGSNLCQAHMRRRCPAARSIAGGAIYLNRAQLLFRGVADVTVGCRGSVPGGLWLITPECERSLDQYEGVGSRIYLKRYLTVRDEDGTEHDALFYQMATHQGVMPPSEDYLETIAQGYEDFGLDLAYLDDALQRSWDDKHLTAALQDRHRRRGYPRFARPGQIFELSEADLREAGAV